MVRIDKIFYINSEDHADRKETMASWLKECVPEDKIERIESICAEDNTLLKTQSHMKALEAFIESGHAVCCIFEDDFTPVDKLKFWMYIARIFMRNIKFDLVQFTSVESDSTETEHQFLVKPSRPQIAAGYMITREFAPTLLEYFKAEAFEQPENLMTKWYGHIPVLGYKSESINQ
jgi:hypothetical protein